MGPAASGPRLCACHAAAGVLRAAAGLARRVVERAARRAAAAAVVLARAPAALPAWRAGRRRRAVWRGAAGRAAPAAVGACVPARARQPPGPAAGTGRYGLRWHGGHGAVTRPAAAWARARRGAGPGAGRNARELARAGPAGDLGRGRPRALGCRPGLGARTRRRPGAAGRARAACAPAAAAEWGRAERLGATAAGRSCPGACSPRPPSLPQLSREPGMRQRGCTEHTNKPCRSCTAQHQYRKRSSCAGHEPADRDMSPCAGSHTSQSTVKQC